MFFDFVGGMTRAKESTVATEKKSKKQDEKKGSKKRSKDPSRFYTLFGFNLSDLSSWDAFQKLLHRPTDPSSLAILRIFYGETPAFRNLLSVNFVIKPACLCDDIITIIPDVATASSLLGIFLPLL